MKHRRVPLRTFSVLWDNKFSIENRDIHLLGIKFFDTRNFLKHRRVSLRNDSVLWDKTKLTENRNSRPLCYPWLFSIPEINETLKNSPTKIFGTVRQKIFEGTSWYFPLPLIHKLIRYRKLSETQHRRVPCKNFRYCETKKFDRRSWHNLLKHKIFWYPKSMIP